MLCTERGFELGFDRQEESFSGKGISRSKSKCRETEGSSGKDDIAWLEPEASDEGQRRGSHSEVVSGMPGEGAPAFPVPVGDRALRRQSSLP